MDLDALSRWTRLEGALRRFTGYIESQGGSGDSYTETLGRLGLAMHAKNLFLATYDLAEEAGLLPEFLGLFTSDDKEDLSGTGRVEHSLGAVALLTGWIEGLIKGATLEARIQADAEAYAKERVKSENFGFRPPHEPPAAEA